MKENGSFYLQIVWLIPVYITLSLYDNEPSKNKHFLILLSSLGIHGNINWKEFLKSRESFLRKVSVCTLTDLNPGFDGPWKKLWIFFVNGTFIMPQKKSFGQKNFWISCTGSKVPFWQFFNSVWILCLIHKTQNSCTKFLPCVLMGEKYFSCGKLSGCH